MNMRIGFSTDIHRLKFGSKLILGGVVVSDRLQAIAHSDGDCLYHAVAESIYGALGLGDLGSNFPPSDPQTEGLDSSVIVKDAVSKMNQAGYRVFNIDCSIALEYPRLAPFIEEMRINIASLLHIEMDRVSVKAGTNEGLGEIGRGEACQCWAVVLLEKISDNT